MSRAPAPNRYGWQTCAVCGVEFPKQASNHITCSPECYRERKRQTDANSGPQGLARLDSLARQAARFWEAEEGAPLYPARAPSGVPAEGGGRVGMVGTCACGRILDGWGRCRLHGEPRGEGG